MIGTVIVGVLAIVALAYVSRPLVDGPRSLPDQERELVLQEVDARKRAALAAILDIEEEHAVGKLSDADLAALRSQYEAQALSALREMDELAGRSDELEDEIARMRAEMTCSNCGALRTGSKCSRCGSQ